MLKIILNVGFDSEEIYYTGFSEIEDYRTYKRIKGGKNKVALHRYYKATLIFVY